MCSLCCWSLCLCGTDIQAVQLGPGVPLDVSAISSAPDPWGLTRQGLVSEGPGWTPDLLPASFRGPAFLSCEGGCAWLSPPRPLHLDVGPQPFHRAGRSGTQKDSAFIYSGKTECVKGHQRL